MRKNAEMCVRNNRFSVYFRLFIARIGAIFRDVSEDYVIFEWEVLMNFYVVIVYYWDYYPINYIVNSYIVELIKSCYQMLYEKNI